MEKKINFMSIFQKGYFPFIENTFEALDEYVLLCKVVEKLNDVIKNVNEHDTNIADLLQNLENFKIEIANSLNMTKEELNTLISENRTDIDDLILRMEENENSISSIDNSIGTIFNQLLTILNDISNIQNVAFEYRGVVSNLNTASLKGYYKIDDYENTQNKPTTLLSNGFVLVLESSNIMQVIISNTGKIYMRYSDIQDDTTIWNEWFDLSIPDDLNTNYLKFRGTLENLEITDLRNAKELGFYTFRYYPNGPDYTNLPSRLSSITPMDMNINKNQQLFFILFNIPFLGYGTRNIQILVSWATETGFFIKLQSSGNWLFVSYKGVRKSSLQANVSGEYQNFALKDVIDVGSFTIARSSFQYITDLPEEILNNTDITTIELDTTHSYYKIITNTGECWQQTRISGESEKTWTKVYPLAGSGGELNIFNSLAVPPKNVGLWLKTDKEVENIAEVESIHTTPYWNDAKMQELGASPYTDLADSAVVPLGNHEYLFIGGGSSNAMRVLKYNAITHQFLNMGTIDVGFYRDNQAYAILGNFVYFFGDPNVGYNNSIVYKININTLECERIGDYPIYFQSGIKNAVSDGQRFIYVTAGGENSQVWYRLDTVTLTWSQLTNLPYRYSGCIALVNNYIYFFGVRTTNYFNGVYRYNIDTGKFQSMSITTPAAISFSVTPFVNGNDIYIFGPSNRVYVYNIDTNTFTNLSSASYDINRSSIINETTELLIFRSSNVNNRMIFVFPTINLPDKTLAIVTGARSKKTEICSSDVINGLSYTFDNIYYYTLEDGIDTSIEKAYGDGSGWIGLSN